MKQTLINDVSLEELLIKLTELFEAKLEQNKPSLIKNRSIYLSRIDVVKLLKISLPTLAAYTKIGLLQSYKIGNRVLYKSIEVELSIEKLKTYKSKSGL